MLSAKVHCPQDSCIKERLWSVCVCAVEVFVYLGKNEKQLHVSINQSDEVTCFCLFEQRFWCFGSFTCVRVKSQNVRDAVKGSSEITACEKHPHMSCMFFNAGSLSPSISHLCYYLPFVPILCSVLHHCRYSTFSYHFRYSVFRLFM